MRRLLLIVAVSALVAGCTKPCEELGDRLCKCSPTGTSTDTCKREVANVVGTSVFTDAGPTNAEEDRCSKYLDTCNAPPNVGFCDWLTSEDGKVACGLAYPLPP